jgi:ribosomal protein L25 (general stress protein Ctc)
MTATLVVISLVLLVWALASVTQKRDAELEIQRLNNIISSLESANAMVNLNYRSAENKVLIKTQEIATLKAKLEALESVNTSLVKEVSKDEDIKVTVNGANSKVNIQDVDGKTTVVRKKRGRKPGFKRGPYKKKSTGKPN